MRTILLALTSLTLFCSLSIADDGLVNVQSAYDVDTTADRLEQALQAKGMTIFARIDHAKSAQQVEMDLRPTELVIFGNPKVGTLLMQGSQSVAIDLPQKALIWQDESGQVWLSYNDPQYLVDRHGIEDSEEAVTKISQALRNVSQAATTEQP